VRERGSAADPLSWDELVAKYRDCASRALPPDRVERSLGMLSRFEEIESIRDLMECLGQGRE